MKSYQTMLYRIKHKPSGLYYKTGHTNLSKKVFARVYQTKSNALTCNNVGLDYITISMPKSHKIYLEQTKDIIAWREDRTFPQRMLADVPKSEFEIEEIKEL